MKLAGSLPLIAMAWVAWAAHPGLCQSQPAATPLPPGVKAVWDLGKAYRERELTRERICINGLWRWQPARKLTGRLPDGHWGYFKVPGCWPGITDYMQKDSQTLYPHPEWKDLDSAALTAAWYQREIRIPQTWSGRRIALYVEYLNSYAEVYVDGRKAGEIRFPGGEADLTPACRPGKGHVLSILVVALPLKGVLLSYSDTASAREVKGAVARRGLCGDVFLTSTPRGARIADVRVDTSVRRWEIAFITDLLDLAPGMRYSLRACIDLGGRRVREFRSLPFRAEDLREGRFSFRARWKPDRLWDLHTPQNQYRLRLDLLDARGEILDRSHPVRFGFRELWIRGRDFFFNGTRLFLCAVPLDNAQVGAAWATYQGARESLERLKSFGINFVYTHNYGCEPGAHLSFAEILRAADDVGMLVALSQPHFSHYEWQAPDADRSNGYERHARFYVQVAQSHPSVVAYAMSHNATGYSEDMNPDMMDGIQAPRDQWSANNVRLALRAEAIVKRLDPGRIVYHHASGNLSGIMTSNFYPNFAPAQELSDWFEHWATRGVKPVFLCEYGAPFTWDWTMYRGWYRDERAFGSARVPWEFCLAEWNAQFLGDRAYRISEMEKENLRWEARQFREGRLWHRWDYPYEVGSRVFDDRHEVLALYIADNWRAYRTWGVSAISPWEYGHFWKPRAGVSRGRKEYRVDWDRLQRPGFSPDYVEARYERMDLAFDRSDWIPTADGQALMRNNRALLAYIGGKRSHFTSKDHNFLAGETVEKQLILINNSRRTVMCDCRWSFGLAHPVVGRMKVRVPTGEQRRIPLRFVLPAEPASGSYTLITTVVFGGRETQRDAFVVHVVPPLRPPRRPGGKIALFDPGGETAALLGCLKVPYQRVAAGADLSGYEVLVVGKGALTVSGPGPDVGDVRKGLKVVVFEQTSRALEQRLGFRVAEYGLRRVFQQVPSHPLLAGLDPEQLRDWRGEATLLPPRLQYELRPRYGPTVRWCGLDVTRVWRCGNRGNVASVLIEKPARGDFLPILVGGYSLQYSPLMEYREGKGMALFCQMDVTGRSESDPAAWTLARNILSYVSTWKPAPARNALYAGDPAGLAYLTSAGVAAGVYKGGDLSADQVLIVGPDGGQQLASDASSIGAWLQRGGHLLAIGLDEAGANAFLPFQVHMKRAEHIAAFFKPFSRGSLLSGIGPADVYSRDPRDIPLVSGGAVPVGNGVLAAGKSARVVFCQLVPWQFDFQKQMNLKRTYRRASFAVARLLANMGVAGSTPLLGRFHSPCTSDSPEQRWLDGLYRDPPEEWDDPYRFFRW